ncbi:MAG TPA: preprotein translocase subunit YajC [Blastocatellia bacterium]|nr:preprotein translocase subunit YajC [Blastocatellia bacterium]
MSQQIALLLFQAQTSPYTMLVPMVLVFVLFYFLIVVPQRKRQRTVDEMLNNLKPNDKVVTNGGIYGTIVSVRDDKRTVQLKISENPVIRVEVARTAISGLQDAPAEEKR